MLTLPISKFLFLPIEPITCDVEVVDFQIESGITDAATLRDHIKAASALP